MNVVPDPLAVRIGELLNKRAQTVGTAESCTGGLLAGTLTAVPGISQVFEGSVVAYQNRVKEHLLAVEHEILVRHGAVSTECAAAMAAGVKKLLGTDFAVSVTGIAGPDGGTPEKPVGTVCFGIAAPHGVRSVKRHFDGGRDAVRSQAVHCALELLRKELEFTISVKEEQER